MPKVIINDRDTVTYDGKTYTYDPDTKYYYDENKNKLSIDGYTAYSSYILHKLASSDIKGEQIISRNESSNILGSPVFTVNGKDMYIDANNTIHNYIKNEDYIGAKSGDIKYNGQTYTMSFTSGHGIKRNQAAVLEYFKRYGKMPTDKRELDIAGTGNFNAAVAEVKKWLQEQGIYDSYMADFEATNGFTKELSAEEKAQREAEAEQTAYDNYWNNLYSRNEGTLGKEAYDQLVQAERNAGRDAIDLANAQAQQAGMAQAATVKSITDSLKAERMARLRAGMSESQIASQDMQTMIANTNALNEQIAATNLAAMQGQQQYNNAETTAYQNWLNSMNQAATPASAFAAADAGNADYLARQYAARTGVSYQQAYKMVTGQNNIGGK